MSMLRQLAEKPWQQSAAGPAPDSGAGFARPAATVALRMFLGVVGVLFSLLVVAYSERMAYEDWRPAPPQWLLWWNTTVLVVSSAALQWAAVNIRRGRLDEAKAGLLAAGLFAAVFLGGQLWAWQQLRNLPVFDITNPAVAFFYMITALHAPHLLGGLVAVGRTPAAVWNPQGAAGAELAVLLCATYWHFLLAVWLVLFGLLFSGSDNLGFLLAICGLR